MNKPRRESSSHASISSCLSHFLAPPDGKNYRGRRESSPGQGARVAAHRAQLLRATGPRQDQDVSGLLLERRCGGDLRGPRGTILLRSGSPREREPGRGLREGEGRGDAAGVDADPAEGEPREEDEREEEPAEGPRHLRRRQRRLRRGMLGFEWDQGNLARGGTAGLGSGRSLGLLREGEWRGDFSKLFFLTPRVKAEGDGGGGGDGGRPGTEPDLLPCAGSA
jgi:hypothetical protein